MGRFVTWRQEILVRNEKLVGFNAGYDFVAEHEDGYSGYEQREVDEFILSLKGLPKTCNLQKLPEDHPFKDEQVINPGFIQMIKFDDGNIFLTTNSFIPENISRDSNYKNKLQKMFKENCNCMVAASWSEHDFSLMSTDEVSKELLLKLYEEIQKGNVAISSDYSFMFQDRGLSFVLLDQLSKEDLMNKKYKDNREKMMNECQAQYREYLKQEGFEDLRTKYCIQISNVQITDIDFDGNKIMPEFYLELYDKSKFDDHSPMRVPRRMTGDEIKHLVSIIKTDEFNELAETHSKLYIENYINEMIEKYKTQVSMKSNDDTNIEMNCGRQR